MKRKTRFQEGGSTGRFEEDLYARARRFVEEQERRAGEGLALTGDETPKVAPRPANCVEACALTRHPAWAVEIIRDALPRSLARQPAPCHPMM